MIFEFLIYFIVYLGLANWAVNMAYHRYLAHKSFEPHPVFKYFIVILGLPAGTPLQWAGNHRAHHRYADTEKDPHSPYYGGLWWAHCGWYIQSRNSWLCVLYALAGPFRTLVDSWHRPRSNQQYNDLAKDIQNDRGLAWLSRPAVYTPLCLMHLAVQLVVPYLIFGPSGLILAWLVSVVVYNLGDAVDSLGHYWGKAPYPESSLARDNPIIAWVTFGDGWHGSHHRHPNSPRHGLGPYQFDWTYWQLRLFSFIGLIRSLKPVPETEWNGLRPQVKTSL